MKNKTMVLYSLLLLFTSSAASHVQAQQNKSVQPIVYQLDIHKSKLLWQAPKNQHNGHILFTSGFLTNVVEGMPTRGSFSINMNSMKSTDESTAEGRKKVDEQLRSDVFFSVSKHPLATMIVQQIVPDKKVGTYKVSGLLTIKGVTNAIELTAVLKQNGNTLTATAATTISRAKWGINSKRESAWGILDRVKDHLVDDEIPVRLDLVFTKK